MQSSQQPLQRHTHLAGTGTQWSALSLGTTPHTLWRFLVCAGPLIGRAFEPGAPQQLHWYPFLAAPLLHCRMASRCFWDSETDHYAFDTFSNVSTLRHCCAGSVSLGGNPLHVTTTCPACAQLTPMSEFQHQIGPGAVGMKCACSVLWPRLTETGSCQHLGSLSVKQPCFACLPQSH